MANVSFDEEPQYTRRTSAVNAATEKQGSIIGVMYRLGVAKTQKDANVVMGSVVLVCILVSATMFVFVQPHTDPARQAALQRDVDAFNAAAAQRATQPIRNQ